MSDVKVCRICLCKGVKLYNYNSFHLKQYYEEIMAKKVNEKDGLPNYFCYECAAFLYKFHKFKEKCWTGENVLQELVWSGSITLSSISHKDRQDKNLQSSIGIITVSKRVRTQIIKHKTLSNGPINEVGIKGSEIPEQEIPEQEIPEQETPEVEECKITLIVYESDNSLDDRSLAEIKNKMITEEECFIEDKKPNIEIEESTDKAMLDLEDDKRFSDDEDVWPENTKEVDKPTIKEEINNEITVGEKTKLNTELENSDNEIVINKNVKGKKAKSNKDLVNKKSRKFEVGGIKGDYLDPKHWLKINLTEGEALEEFRARAQSRQYVSAAFQCSDCFKGFSKEDMLNRHVKLKHSESRGPVECRLCKMRFKLKCFLTRHIPQHYSKYKCLRCDVICPLKTTAVFHNEYHNGVKRKCIHCGEEFRHRSTYYTHLRTHRSEHVCTLCGASFVSTLGLNIHKRNMHVNTIVNPEEEVNTYCERCDIKFETRKAYDEHVFHSANHTEGVEALARGIPEPSKAKLRKKLRRGKPRQITPCTICNRIFPSQATYLKHHAAEHKDKPLPSKEQRQICEICGASLALGSVASHLNTHTREKLYTCNTCGRQFNSKTGLNTHQLTHTSVKPVACTLCDKRFKQVSSMKLHYRTYHLKEPYPKRNRKKKDELSKDEYGHEDSDDNMTLNNFYARNNKLRKMASS